MDYAPGPIASTEYSVLELADEPIDFVRGQLTDYGLTLSNALVRHFPKLSGSYRAIVPTGTTRARALQYRSGWPAPRRPDNPRWSGPIGVASRLAAATVIMDLIEANGHGFVIGEDFMARPTDRWLKPVPTTLVAYDQVYQWSGTTDVPFDTAHEIVDLSNRTFVSNIIVAAPDGAEAYMAPSNRPEEIIDYAASHAVAVLVGAFDGEGYILWFPA